MESQINSQDQNNQQGGQNPSGQPVVLPEKPKVNYPLIGGVVLVCFLIFGFGGYYLGKQSSTQPSQSMVEPSQATNSTATPIATSDPTIGWKTFSDPAWNITFKYPSDVVIEKKQNLSADAGVPKDYIQIGSFLSLAKYYDRTKTLFYTQNADLLERNQNDLQPAVIDNQSYTFSKVNWEDGVPSQEVPNCNIGTAQPNYFVDIPNKLSVTILFQILKTCDPVKGQIVQKGMNGNPVLDFDKQLQTDYQILSTIKFQ